MPARWRAPPCGRSALSTPIPNALVATMTRASSAMKRRWTAARALAVEPGVVGQRGSPSSSRQGRRQLLRARARARVDDRRQGILARAAPPRSAAASGAPPAGTTAKERLGRSKPVATRSGSRSPSRRTTSAATRGVAVAVEATIDARAEAARGVGQAEVVGPEVVPPLGDAMGLVDHEQADARLAHPLDEPRRREALGSDVEKPQLARRRPLRSPRSWRPRPAGR